LEWPKWRGLGFMFYTLQTLKGSMTNMMSDLQSTVFVSGNIVLFGALIFALYLAFGDTKHGR
jgi:hypothetical protein